MTSSAFSAVGVKLELQVISVPDPAVLASIFAS
jgi:hypothetical protein